MDPITIASLVAAGAKGIGSLIQGIGGARQQKNLWQSRPLLGVTEGEEANDQLYKQMAAMTELPGQKRFEEKLGQTYAEGVYDTGRSATSSVGATQSAVDLASKKMDAIRDLSGMFAEFKAQRQDALGRWNDQKIGLEQQRFQVNEFDPWNVKMNEAVARKQAGFGGAGSAIDTGLGMLGDYAGTQNYLKMIQSLYPTFGGANPMGNQSAPLKQTYNPQENLLNTLRGITPKPRF